MAYVPAAHLAGSEPNDPEPLTPSKSRNNQIESLYAPGNHRPSLSEYQFWARLKRQEEINGTSMNGVDSNGNVIAAHSPFSFIKYRGKAPPVKVSEEVLVDHKYEKKDPVAVSVTDLPDQRTNPMAGLSADEIERLTTRRQLRLASWTMMFYLITTDILGPFNAPYAIANMGLVPGICCYVFFGIIVSFTAFSIGYLFLHLDSDRFPIRTYGDIAGRVVGPWFRHLNSILQSIQLVVNVGLICLSSGQSLYQVAHNNPCFSVAVVIMALVGMIVGQIRSLRNFAFIGQCSVFINLTIIFVSMGVVAHTLPNYAVANAANNTLGYGPVVVQAFNTGSLVAQINGMFNLVFAWGGAMIFPEMISEMRRPMDFWKGMVCADTLIGICYLLYGVFWYCFQGQYTQANSFQGLSPYWAQTFCNVLNMVSGLIAACLYGNIGVKVIYVNIIQDLFKGPPMNTKKGRIIWTCAVPIYWSLAFVIANSIPALGAMTGLIGAVCIFQFSYTFPPLILLVYHLKKDGAALDTAYNGYGTQEVRYDSWRSAARWKRALFTVAPLPEGSPDFSELPRRVKPLARNKLAMTLLKIFLFGFVLACLATTGMGLWGTGNAVKQTFEVGQGTAFGCKANA